MKCDECATCVSPVCCIDLVTHSKDVTKILSSTDKCGLIRRLGTVLKATFCWPGRGDMEHGERGSRGQREGERGHGVRGWYVVAKQELTLIHIGQDCVAEGNQLEEPCYVLEKVGREKVPITSCHGAPHRTRPWQNCLHVSRPLLTGWCSRQAVTSCLS